ncbi:amino acid adenylation domain-containing protein, partial [Thalassotalea sp. 1_MG-2023]|uniref:amino acid adenylation domain-containing protein n=1 Tax=Thalassotalea sp. 1_MG-2023 TaxID=3062680 RepID=UPI0026E47140
MRIEQLIKELRNNKVKLKLDQQQLICELPKSGVTQELREQIIVRKEELKQFLKQYESQQIAVKPRNRSANHAQEHSFVLSCNQQVLWTDQQVHGCRSSFHMPFAFRLRGSLNREAFQHALDSLVARHEILRTTYTSNDLGEASQYIQPARKVDISEISQCELNNYEDKLLEVINEESAKTFDFENDLMLRVTLIKESDTQHIVLLTMHHIASDGWSMAVMLQEFNALYNGYIACSNRPLPELALQYADYALWQQDWLNSEAGEKALNYWQGQLADLPVVHQLKLDYQRPETQSFNGSTVRTVLKPEVLNSLKAICRHEGATLFMGLHSIFSILLARFSGEQDIVMGASAANRGQHELAGLIGFFVNMLVLRSHVSEEFTLRSLLNLSKTTLEEAYAHQQVPLVKLIEMLKPSRSLSHNPLFQIVMVLQNNEQSDVHFTDLEFEPIRLTQEGSKYDLTLGLFESAEGLVMDWEYNSDLFAESSIRNMADYFCALTSALVLKPDNAISTIKCLDDKTLDKLSKWQGDAGEETSDLWSEFELQVESHGCRIAVRDREQELSYFALRSRVEQWGSVLAEQGVKPGDGVGVLLPRSIDAVTAILAIVRTGAKYVPLEAQYPSERLQWMMEDAGVQIVLCNDGLSDVFEGAKLLNVHTFDDRQVGFVPAAKRNASQGSYLMYTSGSTGKPKGVQVPDGAVVRLCRNSKELSVNADDVLLLQAPLVFDASTLELWAGILNGACVAIGRPGSVSVDGLASDISDYGVTVLWLTASLMHVVIDERIEALKGLRCLVAGGDALSGKHVNQYLEAPWSNSLVNGYGPTEATTFSCLYQMSSHKAECDVPIGYPLSLSSCYVLDESGEPVPLGVPGELYVGGAGLAHGYWGQSAKTASVFIPNPFGPAGSRMYRTGDRVRYNASGALEFLGRRDAQVKVRGYRIELGEIEHALKGFEGVVHAITWIHDDAGHKRLFAAVSGQVKQQEVQAYLKSILPEYMQPHQLAVLESMPLTVNGKVDRTAVLNEISFQKTEANECEDNQPLSALENKLIGIWREVLQVEDIGSKDSFFELGGDSILSIQLAARGAVEGINFTLEDIFEHDTVASLAAAIGSEQINESSSRDSEPFELIGEVIRTQLSDDIEDAYPVSQLQQGMLYHSLLLEGKGIYHDIIHYRCTQSFNEVHLHEALAIITERHPVLRTEIALDTFEVPLQLVYRHAEPKLDVIKIKNSDQETLDEWLRNERIRGFDKVEHPLIRFAAFTNENSHWYIGLSFHHAILDGWSEASLIAELMQIYGELLDGRSQKLVPISATYRDFIAREQAAINDQEQHDFWQKLENFEPGRIKLARTSKSNNEEYCLETSVSDAASCALDASQSSALRQMANDHNCSLKTIMLCAHLKTLSLASSSDKVVSGVSFHGRPEVVDSEKVLGLFVNMLPVPLSISDGSWTQLIDAVEISYKSVMQHRYYPLAEIKRRLGGHALFDVSFNYTQ